MEMTKDKMSDIHVSVFCKLLKVIIAIFQQ